MNYKQKSKLLLQVAKNNAKNNNQSLAEYISGDYENKLKDTETGISKSFKKLEKVIADVITGKPKQGKKRNLKNRFAGQYSKYN